MTWFIDACLEIGRSERQAPILWSLGDKWRRVSFADTWALKAIEHKIGYRHLVEQMVCSIRIALKGRQHGLSSGAEVS